MNGNEKNQINNTVPPIELKTNKLSFLVIGDWGKTVDGCKRGTPQYKVAQKLKDRYSDNNFVISVGDNFYFEDKQDKIYKQISINKKNNKHIENKNKHIENNNKQIKNKNIKPQFEKQYLTYWYNIWYNCYMNCENYIPWFGTLGNKEYQYHCNLTPNVPYELQSSKGNNKHEKLVNAVSNIRSINNSINNSILQTSNKVTKWKMFKLGYLNQPYKNANVNANVNVNTNANVKDNVLFIFIDTTPFVSGEKEKKKGKCVKPNIPYLIKYTTDYINKKIQENPHKYCILVGHHPAYSKGHLNSAMEKKGGNNKEIIEIIEDVNKDKQQIHIYMCGHEHYLGVLKKGDKTYDPTATNNNKSIVKIDNDDNVVYVISGCGGGDADIDPNKPDDTPRYGFFEFIVTNDKLSYIIHKTHKTHQPHQPHQTHQPHQIWRNISNASVNINF